MWTRPGAVQGARASRLWRIWNIGERKACRKAHKLTALEGGARYAQGVDESPPPVEIPETHRLFDVVQANALVPVLERVFSHVRNDREEMHALVAKLRDLGVEPNLADADAMPKLDREAEVLYTQLRATYAEVLANLSELNEMGIEVKKLDGLVDLRSMHRGEEVYLCWRYGEPRFAFWHKIEAGFDGRKRIIDPDEFTGTLLC